MEASKRTVPLGDVLEALARELDMLGDMSRSAQEVVCQLLATSRNPGDGSEKLQQLDLLTQHLEELVSFLNALARLPVRTYQVDVEANTTQMRLAGLACRLRCEPPLETSPPAPATGDAEWF